MIFVPTKLPPFYINLNHPLNSMLSSPLSSPVTSPNFLNQSSPPNSPNYLSTYFPLSPRAAAIRRVSCSSIACSCSAADTSSFSSLYDILGISTVASDGEIKAAYRRLARSYHPDAAGVAASDAFIRVNDAYSTLSDPDKRADYDRSLFFQQPYKTARINGLSGKTSSFCCSPRKNWESDQCW